MNGQNECPAALASSTSNDSVADPAGVSELVPLPPKTSRRKRKWWLAAAAILLVALIAGLSKPLFGGGSQKVLKNFTIHTVRYENWGSPIEADGDLETAESSDIICHVQALAPGNSFAGTIKWVIEDGTKVNKGQVVVRIDDAALQDELASEQIARDGAKLEWEQAKGNRVIVLSQNDSAIEAARSTLALAKIDLEKYLKGDHPQALEDVNNRLSQWLDRTAYSKRMVRKGFMSHLQARNDGMSLDRVEQELRVLEYTKVRTVTELRANLLEAVRAVERARTQAQAREYEASQSCLVKKQIYLQREIRIREIQEQIARCTLRAPREGQVVYHISPQSKYSSGAQQSVVAQGEPVREGQILMHIPNLKRMQIRVLVHESQVTQLRADESTPSTATRPRRIIAGQPALIRLNAYPGRVFRGHVKRVAGVGTMIGWRTADVKVYQTVVAIDDTFDGIRPNMSAHVTILADNQARRLLTVPVAALTRSEEKGCTCLVNTPDGPEEREVVVGLFNKSVAEIRLGLVEGEDVILDEGE
jgi:HlyD family secretion protein